jgi:hypothetical protein
MEWSTLDDYADDDDDDGADLAVVDETIFRFRVL